MHCCILSLSLQAINPTGAILIDLKGAHTECQAAAAALLHVLAAAANISRYSDKGIVPCCTPLLLLEKPSWAALETMFLCVSCIGIHLYLLHQGWASMLDIATCALAAAALPDALTAHAYFSNRAPVSFYVHVLQMYNDRLLMNMHRLQQLCYMH